MAVIAATAATAGPVVKVVGRAAQVGPGDNTAGVGLQTASSHRATDRTAREVHGDPGVETLLGWCRARQNPAGNFDDAIRHTGEKVARGAVWAASDNASNGQNRVTRVRH